MSAQIDLVPGERVVAGLAKEAVVLTNRRVRLDTSGSGRTRLVSMALESVASCGLETRAYPLLLVFAGFAALLALVLGGEEERLVLLVVAAALAVMYLLSRQAVVSIASRGGQAIQVPVKGQKREAIVAFLEAVEREQLGAGRD